MPFRPNNFDGQAPRRPIRALARIVFGAAPLRIFGYSNIKGTVSTAQNIAVVHKAVRNVDRRCKKRIVPLDSRKLRARSGQNFASRAPRLRANCARSLGTKFRFASPSTRANCALARDKISLREILEAGGVEPPSERPCSRKTTCLARSRAARPCGHPLVRQSRLERARNAAN